MKLHDGILTIFTFLYNTFYKITSIGMQTNGFPRLEKYKYLYKSLT